jgi:hypothetical protein
MPRDTKVRTYDPNKISMTFGSAIISGLAEDTFVTIAPRGDAFETQQGANGDINRVNKNMFSYIVTIVLNQTSPTNKVLSDIHSADKTLNTGVLPLIINDLNGESILTAPQGWIAKEPDGEKGSGISNREWIFHTGISANVVGGNN